MRAVLALLGFAHALRAPQLVLRARRSSALSASGGPPQYDKVDATLVANEVVGRGSHLLRLESETPLEYKPGHVLALEFEEGGEWLKGPYTVSRASESTFDVVIRVVGKKSEAYAAAAVGSKWRFGGKFHVPISEGIAARADRVVCVSTGTGFGPVLGFAEDALAAADDLKVTVLAGFREVDDVCCKDAVQRLCVTYPDRFECAYVVSSSSGRVSSPGALASVAAVADAKTHFHLIGNGAMVNEWTAGLKAGGVPEDLVTTETYFNHKDEPDAAVVDRIAAAIIAGRVDVSPPQRGAVTQLEGGVMI